MHRPITRMSVQQNTCATEEEIASATSQPGMIINTWYVEIIDHINIIYTTWGGLY